MTVFDILYNLYNPWIAAIIGGTFAPVIGVLILAGKCKSGFSSSPGAIVIIPKLLLYTAICAGLGGLLLGSVELGLFPFSIQKLDILIPGLNNFIRLYLFILSIVAIFIRIFMYIFCAGGIFLAMFFDIDIYDLMRR